MDKLLAVVPKKLLFTAFSKSALKEAIDVSVEERVPDKDELKEIVEKELGKPKVHTDLRYKGEY